MVAGVVPPLEDFARTALRPGLGRRGAHRPHRRASACSGAPAASTAALDYAFTRIFRGRAAAQRDRADAARRGRRRVLLVGLPLGCPPGRHGRRAGCIDLAPARCRDHRLAAGHPARVVPAVLRWRRSLVFRFVPARSRARRACCAPAIARGRPAGRCSRSCSRSLAPMLTRMAAIYGTFVAFFALLAWLSISYNVLLARARAGPGCRAVRRFAPGAPIGTTRRRRRPGRGRGGSALARAAAAAEPGVRRERQAAADARLRRQAGPRPVHGWSGGRAAKDLARRGGPQGAASSWGMMRAAGEGRRQSRRRRPPAPGGAAGHCGAWPRPGRR